MSSGNGFALTLEDTAHLLGRTGFGLSSNEWAKLADLDRPSAVAFLLAKQNAETKIPEPELVSSDAYKRLFAKGVSKPERKKIRKQFVNRHRKQLQRWWWQQMLATDSELNERMVLFWHGHFTSDVRKTHAPFMYRQNQLMRKHGLGNFEVLLRHVVKGAAMQLYLDNTKNRKGKPNENLARELLELYTLGKGHYTETDVREVARALTGWKVRPDRTGMIFKSKHHDVGDKTILGRTGNWSMDDVIDILLESPETSEFITRKLWKEFVSPDPIELEVKQLAQSFRNSGYDITKLLSALLTSDDFWDSKNRYSLIKPPVELALGLMRDYSIVVDNTQVVINRVEACGQQLFYPPDVKGWRGHTNWLNAEFIVRRQELTTFFLKQAKRTHRSGANKAIVENTIKNDWAWYEKLNAKKSLSSISNTKKQLKAIVQNDFYQLK